MTKNIFRSVSLVVCLSLILSSVPWSPSVGLAADAPEDSITQPISRAMEMGGNLSSLLWSPPATSPLVEVARQQAAEQSARPEPEPVPPEEPLPPGTVPGQQPPSSRPPRIPLPLPVDRSGDEQPDIALDPEVWMAETADWTIHELGNIPDIGEATVRYPATWKPTDISTARNKDSLHVAKDDREIQIVIDQDMHIDLDKVYRKPPPEVDRYRQKGYVVREITVKGLPGWEVISTNPDDGLCREVIVALPQTWIRFQLQSDERSQRCQEYGIFDLIMASLQIAVAGQSQAPPADISAPANVALSYDRQAAYDYAAEYGLQTTNSDNYYIWVGGVGYDGAHYLAHVMEAGGFPIHWSAGQDNDDPVIRTIEHQRTYIQGFGDVEVTSQDNLDVGDIIYINGDNDWCWGQAVVRMDGNIPYISTHSIETFDVRYDLYYCGSASNHWYEFNHINATADLKLNSGLDLNPSTQAVGQDVTASFTVHNYGGENVNLSLRVATSGGGDFPTVSCNLSAGGDCSYNETRSFSSVGTFDNTCAQMDAGSGWQNIPAEGSAVTCRTLNIVEAAAVRLSSDLELTPDTLDESGGTVQAHFTVENQGGAGTTERFRARATSGSVTFAETGDVSLNPGDSYTYDDSQTFSQIGLYEIQAEHYVDSSWEPLIGNNSGFIRVKAPPPSPEQRKKGHSPTSGQSGEPVDTSIGNYFYNYTDMSDPTPGLSLQATRWYNALDADEAKGPFGYGTSWTYNVTVTWRVDMSALVRMPDGHLAHFVGDVLTTTLLGTYSAQGDDTGTLERFADDTGVLTTTGQTVYHFDATGRLTHVTHPHPAQITVVYSGDKPSQLVHSAGVTYDIAYSGDLITGIASSSGRAVTYTYTISDDLETVTRPDGSVYTYTYDANHRLTEGRQPNGHVFVRNVYDGEGRVIEQYDQTGKASAFSYGPTITETRAYTDALGSVVTHTYDSDYRLIEEMDELGHVVTYTRDAHGNVVARRDKNGEIWRYTYDDQSNMLSETDPLNNTWTYTYDGHNNRTSQTGPLGNTWEYEYDEDDRLIRTFDPVSNTHEYDYDGQGNLIRERDENGAETQYEYNALGWRTAIIGALGNVTRIAYDDFGNQTVYTDANGHIAAFVYDGLNRLVESVDPMGTVVTFTYDALGNLLTESDGMGHLKHYTYNEYDRIVAETDFEGNTTRYGYDALGRRTVVTDALAHTTVYTYDAVGNLVARQAKDGAVAGYEYDPVGRLIRETDSLGRTTEYVYDAAGRQIEMRRPCDVCAGGVAVSHTTYDAAGRVVQETDSRGATTRYGYDELGRLAVMTDTYGYIRTTTYDPAGRVIQETAQVGAVTHYEYDLLGQLVTTTNALGYQTINRYDAVGLLIQTANERGYTTTTTYDANDQVTAVTDALGNVHSSAYDAAGHLISTTDPLSHTTTYTYDANGNRLTTTDPLTHTTTYVYDALNRIVEVIDPASCCGGSSRYTAYDAVGRVISETDALSYTRVITYDVVGRRIAERGPLGYTTVYTYDSADNLITRQEPTGAVWRFEYDANSNQVRQIDPLGQVQETEYDLLNRAIRDTDPLGAVDEREYDGAGQMIARTDPRRATTHYAYDLLGRQVEETDPLGHTAVYTYDGAGNLVAVQDRRGFVSAYVYDGLNRQIAQTDALGHTRYTLYDEAGQVEAEIDYNDNTTQYTYDEAGNQVQVTDSLGHTTVTEYDALNLPVAVTDPLTRTRRMAYDALGRVISETTPLSHTTVYTYNAEGQRTARTGALGHTWTTEYDAAGRPIHETDPLSRVITTTYDALGRVIASADPLSCTTHYAYDPAGRLTAVTGPDGTEQRYTYDPAGNILTERDGNGHTTRYWRDQAGHLIRKMDPLGRMWRYAYDPEGNLVETITPSGHTITHEYDGLGRLVNKAHVGQVGNLSYQHDANGNRTAMTSTLFITDTLGITGTLELSGTLGLTETLGVTHYVYDDLNRLIESSENETRTVQYAYDDAGQQASLTYPDGTMAHYAYDDDGNLRQVTAPDGGITTYERDALGRPVRVVQANGVVVETTYDAVGNTLDITQRSAGGAVFARHTYTVDDADRRVQKVEALPQGTVTTGYTYDDLDRLVSSLASDGRETHYAFDDAGNRAAMWGLRLREGVFESYRIDYVYNAANQLVRTWDSADGATVYIYDADGNRTGEQSLDRQVAYAYDAEGLMTQAAVQVGQVANLSYKDGVYELYAYDGDGRRARKVTVSANLGLALSVREYRYDDASGWDVLQTYDVTFAEATESQFLYDQSLHKLAYWQGDDAGYFQNDGLGSVLGATDGNGDLASAGLMRYGDYGGDLGPESALPTEDGFTGYERESYTGLDYARNRYYDPGTGTFLTVDPFPVDRQDVLGLHRYLYVQANPVNMIDPLGLFQWTSATSGVIEWGDTLWAIAAEYWGVSRYQVTWDMIYAIQTVNSWIQDPNKIYAGYSLNLPSCKSAGCQAQQQQQNAGQSGTGGSNCGNKCGFNYVVKSGDTLSGIAARYGVPDWHYIWYHPKNYSKISNPNWIYPDQVFYIPCPNGYRSTPPGSGGSSGGGGSSSRPCSYTYPLLPGQRLCPPPDKTQWLINQIMINLYKISRIDIGNIFSQVETLFYFYRQVKTGGGWDYKSNKLSGPFYSSAGIKLCDRVCANDVPGNIVYGYMGLHVGFWKSILADAAGYVHVNPNATQWDMLTVFGMNLDHPYMLASMDDPLDQNAIRRVGFGLFEQGLSRNNLCRLIKSTTLRSPTSGLIDTPPEGYDPCPYCA